MRLSRTDFVPVLAIVAGGVIGASLSFGFLGSRSEDVPPVVYEYVATLEPVQARPVSASPEGAMTCIPNGVVFRAPSVNGSGPGPVTVKISPDERRGRYLYEPLLCIDGMNVDLRDLMRIPTVDIERIEELDADAAVALYGARRGSAGAILVTLKEDRTRGPGAGPRPGILHVGWDRRSTGWFITPVLRANP